MVHQQRSGYVLCHSILSVKTIWNHIVFERNMYPKAKKVTAHKNWRILGTEGAQLPRCHGFSGESLQCFGWTRVGCSECCDSGSIRSILQCVQCVHVSGSLAGVYVCSCVCVCSQDWRVPSCLPSVASVSVDSQMLLTPLDNLNIRIHLRSFELSGEEHLFIQHGCDCSTSGACGMALGTHQSQHRYCSPPSAPSPMALHHLFRLEWTWLFGRSDCNYSVLPEEWFFSLFD